MSMPLSPISTWSKTKSLIQRSMIQSPLVLESKNNKSETMFHESTTSQVNSDIFQSYTLINKQTRIIQPGIDKHSVEIPDDSNTLNTLRKVATTASSKHPSQIELRKIIEKEIHYICSKFIVENSVKEINIDQEERSSILAEIMKGNLHPNIFSVVYSNCIDVMNHQSLPAYFTKCSELMSAELTSIHFNPIILLIKFCSVQGRER